MTAERLFIDKIAPIVKRSVRGTKLFASVTMAQIIEESGWGKHSIGAANNFFGVKATPSWTGRVISASTKEEINGKTIQVHGSGKIYSSYAAAIRAKEDHESLFKVYGSVEDSIKSRNELILTAERYKKALTAKTPKDQIQAIKDAGYASGGEYVTHIMNIINGYGLTELDKSTKSAIGGSNEKSKKYITWGLIIGIPVVLAGIILTIIEVGKKRKK
jgi:mannosyl-glycoprotein endo-beta-N-acetylglucosaminidase